MTDSKSDPKLPLPFHEALRAFVPAELWDDYERPLHALAAEPRRPSYWSMSVRDWSDALEVYESRSEFRAHRRTNAEDALGRIVAHMTERLVAGELTGIVQDEPPFGPWRAIPSLSWRSLEPIDIAAGHFRAGKTQLKFVQVVEGHYEPPIEIVSSGSPGRASSKQLYTAEFRRRRDEGIAQPTVKGEAVYLESWMAQRHPGAPGAEAKTIENNIRADHRAWRSTIEAQPKINKSPAPNVPRR
jgi:hypothetical protein